MTEKEINHLLAYLRRYYAGGGNRIHIPFENLEELLRNGVPVEWQPTVEEIKCYGLTRFFTES